MPIGKFLAGLRSQAQIRGILWRHRVLSIGKPKPDQELVSRAKQEKAAVNGAIDRAFHPALGCLLGKLNADDILDDMDHDFRYHDVIGMFLRGVIAEVIEGRPPLPTEPFDRIGLYMLNYFMQDGDTTLDVARERVGRIVDLYNEGSHLGDWIFAMGREACRTGDSQLLEESYRRART